MVFALMVLDWSTDVQQLTCFGGYTWTGAFAQEVYDGLTNDQKFYVLEATK